MTNAITSATPSAFEIAVSGTKVRECFFCGTKFSYTASWKRAVRVLSFGEIFSRYFVRGYSPKTATFPADTEVHTLLDIHASIDLLCVCDRCDREHPRSTTALPDLYAELERMIEQETKIAEWHTRQQERLAAQAKAREEHELQRKQHKQKLAERNAATLRRVTGA